MIKWLIPFLFPLALFGQSSINVTNFGAIGDAVQFYANTVSNATFITTTNVFTTADIGKAIEVFNCGTNQSGTNCQDMVTTIANVVNGTNIYLNQICQNTLTNTFATVGTDNSLAISNAIQTAIASGTNVIVNVPAGKYLCLAAYNAFNFAPLSIQIKGGGWHLVGEGMTNSVLIGQGGWTYRSGYGAMRGFLFAVPPPITNDYPVSIENLTLDGGVEQGNTSRHGFPASPVDGMGWDTTHDAIDIRGGGAGTSFTHWTWTNVLFTHWRGEIVKSNGQSTNGNLTIVNCIFRDGNATAINIYDSLLITNCLFDNLLQIGEYYQAYSTNTSYMVGNVFTNITGNGMAFNGATGKNPAFYLQNNLFTSVAVNCFETTPGDNIFVISNQFLNCTYPFAIGVAGYQGTFCNSNIVIASNYIANAHSLLQFGGGTAPYPAIDASNMVANFQFFQNFSTNTTQVYITQNGWATNVSIFSNTVMALPAEGINGNNRATISLDGRGAKYAYVSTNNLYWVPTYGAGTSSTNSLSYSKGSRFQLIYKLPNNESFDLASTNGSLLPDGAQILVWNTVIENGYGTNVTLFLSSDHISKVILTNGTVTAFNYIPELSTWTNGTVILPPTTYHLTVNNGSGTDDYGPGIPVPIIGGTGYGYWTPSANIYNTNAVIASYTMPSADSSVTWVDTTPPPGNAIVSGFLRASSIMPTP